MPVCGSCFEPLLGERTRHWFTMVIAGLLATGCNTHAQDAVAPAAGNSGLLTQGQTIPLEGVEGRIDHVAHFPACLRAIYREDHTYLPDQLQPLPGAPLRKRKARSHGPASSYPS